MRNLTSWNSYMQNIHAEFNQLYLTVSKFSSIGLYFGAICLQESWQASDADLSLLQLPGYKTIHQGSKCTKHGRLLIFLSEIRLSYCATKQIFGKVFFINVMGDKLCKLLTTCNIYRPPHDNNSRNNISKFLSELSPVLDILQKGKHLRRSGRWL